jgi:hypothetical protein
MKLSLLFLPLIASAIGCHPTVPLSPPPDASDASAFGDSPNLDDCQKGCAALATVGCTLGDGGDDCAAFMRSINGGKEPNPSTHKPLMCSDVASIRSKADAQRLGFVCPP